ncbi:MAG: alpha/beta hydrolase [Calothrix sp. C42_A2020_038]|nr:alpha/beta hydrolase [Calothrix sp. C42_A2020_038]
MKSLFGIWTSTLRRNILLLVLSMLLPTFEMSDSAQAAQKVYASYSALERSISVTALEEFVRTGAVDESLAVYAQYLNRGQLQELRRVLQSPIKANAVAVSQFLYTPQGEFLLRRLGEVIKTESRQEKSGFHALRSALILAAADPGGLTLLGLLREYPGSSIRIDLARTLGIASELEKMVSDTGKAMAAVSQKANIEAAVEQTSLSFAKLPDFRRKGKFVTSKKTYRFLDAVRNRFLLTDVYLPNGIDKVPVIVISHGVGTDSSNFEYLGSHLASHGFAVVVPNHPGSDTKQLSSLMKGSANEVAEPNEFYNRPLDVKFVLDQVQQRNKSEFRGRLNFEQVGIFGQSFGGYTGLALAGAQINFAQLQKDCKPQALKETWNVSLLLQCRALELQSKSPLIKHNLRDERIKAVIAVNPITSSIFGETGLNNIKIPVMIVASSDDTVAPALYEQILPFSWIGNQQKYLAVLQGGTHFSAIGEGKGSTDQVGLPSNIVGDDPAQARKYLNSLSLPFFQSYVAGMTKYAPYLNAAYAKAISSQPLGLNLIQSLTSTELAQAFNSGLKEIQKQQKP